jgi:type IV secretion system protein VirB5
MTPFRRGGSRYSRTPQPETPYQRAGQAWDERIGSARVQARNWRLAALLALGVAGLATGGLVWRSASGTVTPWVVEVDRLGRVQAVGPARSGWRPTDAQIAWRVGEFVRQVRALPSDPVVLRDAWLDAWRTAEGPAARALGDHARDADPFGRVGREQVAVELVSVVRASPRSFRVEWLERRYRDGGLAGVERWTAIVGVTLRPPHDAQALRSNPLGIHIDALDWARELNP